jgi:hypothetical protein
MNSEKPQKISILGIFNGQFQKTYGDPWKNVWRIF